MSSFNIELYTRNLSTRFRAAKNPFTGGVRVFPGTPSGNADVLVGIYIRADEDVGVPGKTRTPFTGETTKFPLDDGLTDSERKTVRKLLIEMDASEPDPDGYCKIHFKDGGIVSFVLGTLNLEAPCVAFAVEIEAPSNDATSAIYNLAESANLAIVNSSTSKAALTSGPRNDLVAQRWPNATVVTCPRNSASG